MKYEIRLNGTSVDKGEVSSFPSVGTIIPNRGVHYRIKEVYWRPGLNVELLIYVEVVPQ